MTTSMKQPTTYNITRHLRNKESKNSNLGGITLIFDIDHVAAKFRFGYAVCTTDDNFSKFRGRELATNRKNVESFSLPYDTSKPLVDNVRIVLNNIDDSSLSKSTLILKKALTQYKTPMVGGKIK